MIGHALATSSLNVMLAWTPFIHPMNIFHRWWYLLIVPLALGISIVYKAVRVADLQGYWREVGIMSAQIIVGMVAMAIAVMLLVQLAIPWLSAE